MSDRGGLNMRARNQTIAFMAALALSAYADNPIHPTARRPLSDPYFSTDRSSPEVLAGFRKAGDILIPPGPLGIPGLASAAVEHALLSPSDDLDGLSTSDVVDPTATFALLFSVSRTAVGMTPPDPTLVGLGFPFNAQDQAAKRQAPGDEFMSLTLFDQTGPLPTPFRAVPNNTLVFNQNDAGGVDYNVSPTTVSPETPVPPGTPTSEVEASAGSAPSALNGRTTLSPFFFSVTSDSPSLAGPLPGMIYVDFLPNQFGGEELYISPEQLGLVHLDDIDGLIVFDSGNLFFEPFADRIVFTLRPGSPSLGGSLGPGDVLSSRGAGTFTLWCPAQQLGLFPSDPIDALDFARCQNILGCVSAWAIGLNCDCPADTDCDGDVDLVDLTTLLSAFGSTGASALYNERADFDYNQSINLADLSYFLAHFGNVCGS
ncbi:MAG: hypothetical protein HZB38_03535 [Planctomycetes bacterium]|nr:hypothetical protein [Planctomycetota bacterium]